MRVLLTGMSGTGKSSVMTELARRGWRAVDLDTPEWSEWTTDAEGQPDWTWRTERLDALLSEAKADGRPLFLSGTCTFQGRYYGQLDHVVLLSAPADVLLRRVRTRTNNAYGKTEQEQADILHYLETVEPLLRHSAHLELDTSRLSVAEVSDRLEALLRA